MKCLLGKGGQYWWLDIGAGCKNVVPSWYFESFSWGISSLWTPMGVLWPVILLCLVLSSYWVYLRLLPCVHVLLAKMDSSEEAYG